MSTTTEAERLLRRAYEAFNARDMDAALALMHSEVDWPNAMEGTRLKGRDAVRDYWTRQFEVIDSRVEPQGIDSRPDGRIAVQVRQVVRDMSGALLSDSVVEHVYSIRDGRIERMDIADPPGRMTE